MTDTDTSQYTEDNHIAGPHRYLACGGDIDEPSVLTAAEVSRNTHDAATNGNTPWTHLYRIDTADDGATLEPVQLHHGPAVNDNAWLTRRVWIAAADDSGDWFDTFTITTDGRA
jgi:hypothetical protein